MTRADWFFVARMGCLAAFALLKFIEWRLK